MGEVKQGQSLASQLVTWLVSSGGGLALLCAIVAMLAGPGYRLGWWHYTTGFTLLQGAAYGAGLSIGVLLLAALVAHASKITDR